MKKVFLSLLIVMALALCPMAIAETAPDGVYHGTSFGRNGNIDVDVTLSGGAITDVTVTAHTETDNIGTVAVEQMPQRIVEADSIAVDSMSGATFTSNGIKRAVESALTEAGIDVEPFKVEPEKVTGQSFDIEADVVVVGGGGAGLAAAVSALQNGAESVVVIAKSVGNNFPVNVYFAGDDKHNATSVSGNSFNVTDKFHRLPIIRRPYGALPYGIRMNYSAGQTRRTLTPISPW